ncbi:MAG: hypothetical protein AAFV86_22770 [Pseudomonadota bacterium]
MIGIVVSIVVASVVSVQAAYAGAPRKITIPAAAGMAGVMAAFWALAVETLFPHPDFWAHVLQSMATGFVAAAIGAALFTYAATNLITKIMAFKEKYPER